METFRALCVSNAISLVALLLLGHLIGSNMFQSKFTKRAYFFAIGVTITMLACEVVDVGMQLFGPIGWLPYLVNILGFSLSATIPPVLALVCNDELRFQSKFLFAPIALVALISIISPWTGLLFRFTDDNSFELGPLFFLYLLVCLYGLVILLIVNWYNYHLFQGSGVSFLLVLSFILICATVVNTIWPVLHLMWPCVTLLLIMYYLFQCEQQYQSDPLTGLFNRTAFEKHLERLERREQAVIVMMDLDGFKSVNDTYGHHTGDRVIRTSARIIRDSFHHIGLCYRLGGDEFCVLGTNTDPERLQRCIQRMIHSVQRQREQNVPLPYISYGVGIYHRNSGEEIRAVFRKADQKMYRYKNLQKEKNKQNSN